MAESNQSVSSKQVRDVVALGRRCSKTAYPTPDREGCPDLSTLRAMAHRDRRLSLTDLPLSHVVSCSPCFQQYLRFRRTLVLMRGLQLTAASLVVLGVLFAWARVFQDHAARSGEPTISQKDAGRSPQIAAQHPPPIAPFAISVNLASFSPTRGEDARNPGNAIHLPSKLVRVRFLLPVGMETGEYALQMEDSTGAVFSETRAVGRSSGGITSLEVDFDLGAASRRRFTLMIRPTGLSWRKFPVVVE
jgi:hypothetical protein